MEDVTVRLMFLFFEETLRHGLQWAAFEANGPAEWNRRNVGLAFWGG